MSTRKQSAFAHDRNKRGRSCLSFPNNRNVPNKQRGFVLLAVVVAITLVAAIALALTYRGASETSITAGELKRDQLRYIAEAGIAHAKAQLALNTSCDNYVDIPKTAFAGATYSVAISPNKGSPIKIKSSVELQDGKKLNINSSDIAAYQPASTVVLQLSDTSGKDTTLDGVYPARNYGGANSMGLYSGSQNKRPVVRFPLDKIPANAKIELARLELRQWNANLPGEVTIHRLTRDWVEGTLNGGGSVADGATWETHDGSSSWSQSGGDYDPTVYAASYVTAGGVKGWDQWDITSLVQEWVSGKISNDGLLLLGDGTAGNIQWASRETNNPPDAPKLTVVYACECGKLCGATAPGNNLLLVVVDPSNLTTQEADKQALIESWGHTVNLIDESAGQAEFDAAVAVNDVAYVGEDISSSSLGTKLRDAAIGVVIEEQASTDEFGISSGNTTFTESSIDITDNGHYITSPFSLGSIAFADSLQDVGAATGTLAPGLDILALRPSSTMGMLDVIEMGGTLHDSGTAAGRRVKLPWGGNDFDINSLTDDGRTIMRRAIEWGAGAGAPTGPIAHWMLDDGTGLTAVDSEGGHDGTLANGPVWVVGQLGDALDFDGTDDYVDLTSDAELDDVFVGGATVMAWIEPAGWGGSGYGRIFDKSSSPSSTGDGWAIRLNTDNGGLNFGQGFTSGRGWWRFAESSINLGTWHHIAVAYDASSSANDPAVYLDGSPVAVTRVDAPSGSIRSDAAINLRLGNHATGTSWSFDGTIDDARIYDRVLGAAEVADVVATGGGGGGGGTYLDEFNDVAYDGSDGSIDWTTTPWQELGDTDGPSSGRVQVLSASQCESSNCLRIGGTEVSLTGRGVSREANLDGATDAELTFTIAGGGSVTAGLVLSVSNDGGANWTDLETYTIGSGLSSTPMSQSFDISAYISATTQVRFVGSGTPDDTAYAFIDNVRISGTGLTGGGGGDGGGGGGEPGTCDGNFRDNFDTRAWNGSNGTLSWATDWIEVGESDGPTSGDTQIMNDESNYQLRTRDNNNGGEGVEREADLSGATTATLSYDYRRMNLDNTDDYTSVQVSANGDAGPWDELTRHDGSGNDSSYQPASHNITAYKSANTRVRFITSSSMGGTDTVWFDNVEITCTP